MPSSNNILSCAMQRLAQIELIYILFTCILFMTVSLVSLAQSASPSTESRLDGIVSRGTLRFGIPGDYPPFGTLDKASGRWTGIDVDEAAGMAKALGVRLVIVRTSWPSLLSD